MSGRARSWAPRQFPFVLPLILLLLAWPWGIFGIVRLSWIPRWAKWPAGLLVGCISLYLLFNPQLLWWQKWLVGVAPMVLCTLMVLARRPKLNGNWVDEQARLTRVEIDGDLMTVENYRHTVYRSLEDYEVEFKEKVFDLSQLQSVDFLVVPFSAWRGLAHVFVSFGFSDGEYLAVSVEARRETGEPYSPVGGLYRMYEVIYVFGDERDVVGKRAVFQKHPVYLHPMIADHASARGLLESMVAQTNELTEKPQFYHTVTNTCTSNVLVHATELENRPRRYDFRLVFPGFADGLGVEIGLIDAPDGLQALREISLINARAEETPMENGKAWSAAVRERTDSGKTQE
ncbi:MAG: hypothetical protein ACI8XO_003469 [Verrucomicrobiales bacterium]